MWPSHWGQMGQSHRVGMLRANALEFKTWLCHLLAVSLLWTSASLSLKCMWRALWGTWGSLITLLNCVVQDEGSIRDSYYYYIVNNQLNINYLCIFFFVVVFFFFFLIHTHVLSEALFWEFLPGRALGCLIIVPSAAGHLPSTRFSKSVCWHQWPNTHKNNQWHHVECPLEAIILSFDSAWPL